jgi:hypothetical protein
LLGSIHLSGHTWIIYVKSLCHIRKISLFIRPDVLFLYERNISNRRQWNEKERKTIGSQNRGIMVIKKKNSNNIQFSNACYEFTGW